MTIALPIVIGIPALSFGPSVLFRYEPGESRSLG